MDAAAASAVVAMIVVVARAEGGMKGDRRRYEMWGGCGPGVLLLLASLLTMTLSSAVVVTLGNILNGDLPSGSLAGIPTLKPAVQPLREQCASTCNAPDLELTAPRPYLWFGALLLAALIVLLLIVGGVAFTRWRRRPPNSGLLMAPSPPPPEGAPTLSLRGGSTIATVPGGPVQHAVVAARAQARAAHRAEKVLAALTYVASVALAGSLSSILTGISATTPLDGKAATAIEAGMWVLLGIGAAFVALAAGGGDTVGKRPLGLIWDLICFLPKAGHPFGPPCYAERVVPELLGRTRWWLTQEGSIEDANLTSSPRRVVYSAHSLGAVLAVAAILGAPTSVDHDSPAMSRAPKSMTDLISLITYGTQLRAYFSRLFPELLGPDVLGTPPCRAADLTQLDPWHTDRRDLHRLPHARAARNVGQDARWTSRSARGLLNGGLGDRGRWLNLWHLTDPIGFPIGTYPRMPAHTEFDWYADEVDRTAYLVATLGHSDYPRTDAYRQALRQMADGGSVR
jgi:hypothetical protein